MRWDLVIMTFSLYNSFTVPIEMAFKPPGMNAPIMIITNYVIDFIFFMDILIAFRTAYIDDMGIECKSTRGMAKNYLKSTFIIDFLATVPFGDFLLISKAYRDYIEEVRKTGGSEWV